MKKIQFLSIIIFFMSICNATASDIIEKNDHELALKYKNSLSYSMVDIYRSAGDSQLYEVKVSKLNFNSCQELKKYFESSSNVKKIVLPNKQCNDDFKNVIIIYTN